MKCRANATSPLVLMESSGDMMKLRRRQFLHFAAAAAALPAASRIARAQSYPTRPVHLIVGFAAGGGADITARLIGQWLSDRLGHPSSSRIGRAPTAISAPGWS
jgi:hypothetical protein